MQGTCELGGGGNLAATDTRLADLANDPVQLQPALALQSGGQFIRQFRKIQAVLAGRNLVEDFAQRIHIRLRRTRPLRRDKSLGADKSSLITCGDKADVGELRLVVHENHVGGLHIAMREAALVEMAEGFRKARTDIDANRSFEADAGVAFPAERAGLVFDRVDVLAGADIVPELHDIVVE